MSEERYLEFDKKMFKFELWGLGALRVLFGIITLVIFWNVIGAVPLAIRIICEIVMAFAYDWLSTKAVKLYATKVLARVSPTWKEELTVNMYLQDKSDVK